MMRVYWCTVSFYNAIVDFVRVALGAPCLPFSPKIECPTLRLLPHAIFAGLFRNKNVIHASHMTLAAAMGLILGCSFESLKMCHVPQFLDYSPGLQIYMCHVPCNVRQKRHQVSFGPPKA